MINFELFTKCIFFYQKYLITNEEDKRKMEKKSFKEAKNYIGISPKYEDICLADISNVKQLEGFQTVF